MRVVEGMDLVQAYGLEGYGRPGFFTTNFTVRGGAAAVDATVGCHVQKWTSWLQIFLGYNL